jgi:ferritin-like metal-binding protein YciE
MTSKTIADLFLHELSTAYSAEKQMTRSLPRMARAASDPQLAGAFERHLQETQGQVERIERIAELLEIRLKRLKSRAMEAMIEEGKDLVDLIERGAVRDAALIGAARQVEHYEIASYTSLCLLAEKLGHLAPSSLLKASLAEEQAADAKLGTLAQALTIEQAVAGD